MCRRCWGVNVHYIPVHLHPYYQKGFNAYPGLCPVAEEVCQDIISLSMFPGMTDEDVERCVDIVCDRRSAELISTPAGKKFMAGADTAG